MKKIVHIDMDAFFASIEQRDNPELRGRPIAVGGNKRRGVVAAASYEARPFGVRSAMPSVIAAKKCPSLIFVKPRFQAYQESSKNIMEIFREFTDLVEPLSLDEAFLDITEFCERNNITATDTASKIKKMIRQRTKLTASAGVSINKFLAKVASDYDKPNGLFVIKPNQAESFIDKLPIKVIPGIGKVTQEKMYSFGIKLGLDLKRKDRKFMETAFGKMGGYFHDLVNLKIDNPVSPNRIRKSIGAERTFAENISEIEELNNILNLIADRISSSMKKKEI
ncbi:DNA polymerase IV, partial [Candidatus Kapabacteria bacterium]|nr:DNA polymerase IV [Candidatus Kapabacteria bacterium]